MNSMHWNGFVAFPLLFIYWEDVRYRPSGSHVLTMEPTTSWMPKFCIEMCHTSEFVHYLQDIQTFFSVTFLLKMDSTILFTHLKFILLQYF